VCGIVLFCFVLLMLTVKKKPWISRVGDGQHSPLWIWHVTHLREKGEDSAGKLTMAADFKEDVGAVSERGRRKDFRDLDG